MNGKWTSEEVRELLLKIAGGPISVTQRVELFDIASNYATILDAEGDGVAVMDAAAYGLAFPDDVKRGRVNQCCIFGTREDAEVYSSRCLDKPLVVPFYTHPARSGVVSDEDVSLLKGIETLCGFVQNGSDTVVKLFQDDATHAWFCKVGNKDYWAPSFRGAINAAIKGERHER